MPKADWPPTQEELFADLEGVRRSGLAALVGSSPDEQRALRDAALRLGVLFPGGEPDIESLLEAAVSDLGETEIGRSARALIGLEPDLRLQRALDREIEAGERRDRKIGQRQFQREYRDPTLRAVARELVKRLAAEMESVDDSTYKSPFTDWHEKAWIRRGEKHSAEFDRDQDFFSRDLVPLLSHAGASQLNEDQQQEILIHSLYNYLNFTVELETGPVNEVCNKLRDVNFLDWLPTSLKEDALRIYTDEGGHAEMSEELLVRVRQFTGVVPMTVRPQFLRVLDKLKRDRLVISSDFVTLLFVIVSETLITGSLNRLPNDQRVQSVVRSVAGHHAKDESKHHAYFSRLLPMVWNRLPNPLKHEGVLLFPHLLKAFLEIDTRATHKIAERYPTAFPNPGDVVQSIASSPEALDTVRKSARPTITLLKREGILDEPGAREALVGAGLIEEEGP
jgi:hypothetical protein